MEIYASNKFIDVNIYLYNVYIKKNLGDNCRFLGMAVSRVFGYTYRHV